MISDFLTKNLPFFNKSKKSGGGLPGLTGNQRSDYILSDFNAALDFESENLERSSEMWKLYRGIGSEQYPKEVVSKMNEEERNPFQGNFIRQKVDGLAGSLLKNFFDVSFEPVNIAHSDLTRAIKELMLIDKELMDWNSAYREFLIDGLVHLGVEEIYIDKRYDPLGNIGFRRIMPGHILLDPHWLSNNTWELKRAWKTAYLTPQQLKDEYDTKSEEIDNYIKMHYGRSTDFDNGSTDEGYPHFGSDETFGDKFRVIEYHHIEREKKKVEVVVASGLAVPEGSDEYKREWAILNNVDLSDGVMSNTVDVDTYYVTSICPSLNKSLILEDKKELIQLGRLPFFPWSAARINGVNSGIPDLLKSIQQTYNYRESMLDFMISSSATGGLAIDPAIVGEDEAMMDLLRRNWNKSNLRFFTAPHALSSGRNFFQELPKTQIDYGVVNELNRMIDMADLVSKQPAAMDARSEGSEESGILYARKQLQAEITQTILMKNLEQHWNDKGEAYLTLAKQLYSGVYRSFRSFGTNKEIDLNVPIVMPSGEVVQNDISELPRMKVIISQSPEGVTTRSVDRAINTELLRVIGPENPISRAQATKNVMHTLDNNKTEKAKYEEAAEIEYTFAKESLLTQIMGLKAQQLQVQMQMQQMMQPQLPGMGAPPPAEEAGPSAPQGQQEQLAQRGPNPSEMGGNNEMVAQQPMAQ